MNQAQARVLSGQFRGDCSGFKKCGSRRSWSSIEEHTLLNAFKDIIASGWKTPNGFRSGFIQQLEARMKLALPGTDLRGDPHILSKYGSWKKTYREVHEALAKTGMGWNSTSKTIQAIPEDWDNMIKYNPDLAHVREKPFPYYEVWVEIYGRDGATGNGAFDFNGPVEENGAGNGTEVMVETNDNSPITGDAETNTQAQSATPRAESGHRTESKGKRNRTDDVAEIVDEIGKMLGNATEALKDVAAALHRDVTMRADVQLASNCKRVYDVVSALPLTLTRVERVRASSALCNRQDQLDMFFELPEAEKCDLVYFALTSATTW